MNKYVSQQGKQLLKNTIQSSNSQNKILEQNLMWKAYEGKRLSSQDREYKDDHKRVKRKRTSNYDHEYDDGVPSSTSSDSKTNYWMKKLVKEEEKQPDRWGHTGYKELYPEDFASNHDSNCSSDSSHSSRSSSSKKKTKKKKSKLKKEKRKKSKKHKKHRRK